MHQSSMPFVEVPDLRNSSLPRLDEARALAEGVLLHEGPTARQFSEEEPMTYLCVTCGTQFSPADHPPERCPICQDERQFVGLQGQQWTTLEKLQKSHRNT